MTKYLYYKRFGIIRHNFPSFAESTLANLVSVDFYAVIKCFPTIVIKREEYFCL